MKKQIVTIVLGAVVMLGTATTLFAQNGPPTGGYPPVMGGAAGNPGFAPGPAGAYGRSTWTSHDQAPQKDLYVSEAPEQRLPTFLTYRAAPDFVVRGLS